MPCAAEVKAAEGDDWVFEVKRDGYHLAVHIEPTGVQILTRGGHDWTHRSELEVAEAAIARPQASELRDARDDAAIYKVEQVH